MIEAPSGVYRTPHPFPHVIVDGLLSAATVDRLAQAVSDNRQRRAGWVAYSNDVERKEACEDLARTNGPVNDLFGNLLGDWFAQELQRLMKVEIPDLCADRTLHGGGIHVSKAGGFLGSHLDYALHPKLSPPKERRLNLILYLSPLWLEEWGGQTELFEADGVTVGDSVSPRAGRALIWEASDLAYHGMAAIADDCPAERLTAAVYYVAPARPGCVRQRALFVPQRGRTQQRG